MEKVWPSSPHAVQWNLNFFEGEGFGEAPELDVVAAAATLGAELAEDFLLVRFRFPLPFFFDFSLAFVSADAEGLSSSPGVAS